MNRFSSGRPTVHEGGGVAAVGAESAWPWPATCQRCLAGLRLIPTAAGAPDTSTGDDGSTGTDASTGDDPSVLAPREREALSRLAEGLTQRQAAARMGVAPTTVDTYLRRIRRKLGPGNTASLVHRATERGLL